MENSENELLIIIENRVTKVIEAIKFKEGVSKYHYELIKFVVTKYISTEDIGVLTRLSFAMLVRMKSNGKANLDNNMDISVQIDKNRII